MLGITNSDCESIEWMMWKIQTNIPQMVIDKRTNPLEVKSDIYTKFINPLIRRLLNKLCI